MNYKEAASSGGKVSANYDFRRQTKEGGGWGRETDTGAASSFAAFADALLVAEDEGEACKRSKINFGPPWYIPVTGRSPFFPVYRR